MEEEPNYALILPLEQISLRRLAVALYSEPRILASMATLKLEGRFRNIWDATREDPPKSSNCSREWRSTVEDKMSKLQLPESLAKEMKPILKAIGSEIFTWISFHEEYFSNPISSRSASTIKLCWTTVGTVDYRKTAEELVQSDLVVDPVNRFELACLYCLEDRIPLLWQELPDGDKGRFCPLPVKTPDLRLFLPHILRKHPGIRTCYVMNCTNPFEKAAPRGCNTLAVYCFWKLTKEERKSSLVRTAKYVILCRGTAEYASGFMRRNLSDIACYLLSLMTPDERMGVFKDSPRDVLKCFLQWPWQDQFLDTLDAIWTFLPESKYSDVMYSLFASINASGYYFPSLFQDVFVRSPVGFKKSFAGSENYNKDFFSAFFLNEDTDTVKVIMRSIDAADRVRLVSGESGFQFIRKWGHNWHLLGEYIRAAGLSKEEKVRLKADFIEWASRELHYSTDRLREEHREFFEFCEETDENCCKKQKPGH